MALGSGIGYDTRLFPALDFHPGGSCFLRLHAGTCCATWLRPGWVSGVPWSLARGPSERKMDLGCLLNICLPGCLTPSRSPPSLPLLSPGSGSQAALPSKVFKCFLTPVFPQSRESFSSFTGAYRPRKKSPQELHLHILKPSCCLTLGEDLHFPRPQFSPPIQWGGIGQGLG